MAEISSAGMVKGKIRPADDLARSAFDDAGIEEFKALVYSAQDEQRQRPPFVDQDAVQPLLAELENVRAQLFVLQKAVESLQQGTML